MDRIAITGVTGALGGRVARLLGPAVGRVVVRDPARAPRIAGEPRIAVAEYRDAEAMRMALDGIDVLLLVSAAESPDRLDEHRTAVRAAADAGVRHVVYTSFDGAAPDSTFTLGRDHWHTEEAIRASGMASTMLRDSFYADFFPSFAGEDGVIRGPAGSGRVAAVARSDVADAAVAVLRDPARHEGAEYRMTGPEGLSMAAATARMTAALQREYRYVEETSDEAYASRRRFTDAQWQLDAWVSTYTAIASDRLAEPSGDVAILTGHAPRTFEQALVGS